MATSPQISLEHFKNFDYAQIYINMGYRMCRRYDNAEQIYLRAESYSISDAASPAHVELRHE